MGPGKARRDIEGSLGNDRTRSEAASAIRELIGAGQLTAGARLPAERVLATRLGLSRSSVREAIRELVAQNVLVTRRGAGSYVGGLSSVDLFASLEFALDTDPRSLLHLFELRRILEPVAAGLAATKLSDEDLSRLEQHAATLRLLERGKFSDVEALVVVDEEIHKIIAEAAGNPLILVIIRSLRGAVQRSRTFTVAIPNVPKDTAAELESVIGAVCAHDPLRAEAAMARHLSRLEDAARFALTSDTLVGPPQPHGNP